jgi:hypothetical protein
MFIDELAALLNTYSQENGSNTPDFLLAEYLVACLATWNTYVVRRDTWYSRPQSGPSPEGTGCAPIGTPFPDPHP